MAQNEPVKCDLFLKENQWIPRYWNKQKVREAVITTVFNKVQEYMLIMNGEIANLRKENETINTHPVQTPEMKNTISDIKKKIHWVGLTAK